MNDLLLPEGALLLHIGPLKTGSTAIQQAMHQARGQLAEHGVFYPGPFHPPPAWRPSAATDAVMGRPPGIGRPTPRIEWWERLVADLAANPLPRACVSNEVFGRATEATGLARIAGDLGRGDPGRLHLVYVARRLDRLVPSMWQQRVKSRATWTYDDYVRRMLAPFDAEERGQDEWPIMWLGQDVGEVLDQWTRYVPPEQITILVAEEGRHERLSEVLSQMLGLPPGLIVPPASNESLSLEQTEVVRALNQVFLDRDWSDRQYRQIMQLGVIHTMKKAGRQPGARRLGFPGEVIEALHERSDRQVEAIAGSGARVLGDPETLRTRGRVEADDQPATIDGVPVGQLGESIDAALTRAFAMADKAVERAEVEEPRDTRSLLSRVRRRLTRR